MAEFAGACKDRGLWPFIHFNRTHVVPPITISDDEMREGLAIIDEALTVADKHTRRRVTNDHRWVSHDDAVLNSPIGRIESGGAAASSTTAPGCPTAGARSSTPGRSRGDCSTNPSATASASLPTGYCATAAGRRPVASS